MLKFALCPAVSFRAPRVRSTTADKAPSAGMRHFIKWCLLCVLVFCSGSVFAEYSCNTYAGGNYVGNIGTVSIRADAAIRSIVISKQPQPGTAYSVRCTNGSYSVLAYYKFSIAVAPVDGYTDVYPTNLAGLGVRYFFSKNGSACDTTDDKTIENGSYTANCNVPGGSSNWSWQASMEFVKTGPITGGVLTSIPEIKITVTSNISPTVWPQTSMYTGRATGTATVPTCSTPDVVIPMGNVNFSTFNRAGVVNDKWNNAIFRVDNCPIGLNRVTIKFDSPPPAGWLDATNGVFNLNNPTDATTAKGIGIQMSFGDNNALATYGSAQTLSGYDAIKTTGGSFTVPIGARYVKPASTLKLIAGQANGSVAFVMSYE